MAIVEINISEGELDQNVSVSKSIIPSKLHNWFEDFKINYSDYVDKDGAYRVRLGEGMYKYVTLEVSENCEYSLEYINKAVCAAFSTTPEKQFAARKNRDRDLVDIRNVFFVTSRILTKNSMETITRVYDKDHATKYNAIKSVQSNIISNRRDFIDRINDLSESLMSENLLLAIKNLN